MLEADVDDYEEDWISKPRLKAKVCLVGDAGVGKTSLIKRFVLDQFDNKYIKTIGTKVSKKSIFLYDKEREKEREVILTIWDIMGQEGFRELLKDAYFCGANGILAVCDATSADTMNGLDGWLDRTYRVAGDVPVSILVNKTDLKDGRQVEDDVLEQFGKAYECPHLFTSAKTGDGVERSFIDLAARIMHKEKFAGKEELVIP